MRLDDLCYLVAVHVDPADHVGTTYLGLEHIASGRMLRIGSGNADDVVSGKSAFQRGDVLYGKLRPYLDKSILADIAGMCTTELLVLRARQPADSRFVACVTHLPTFIEHAIAGTTGVQHPRTSWAHIRAFDVPDHDSVTRRRIADLMWSMEGLLNANGRLVRVAQDMKAAAMRELFTRGLRGEPLKETEVGLVPESWDTPRLDDVCDLSTGTTPATKHKDYYCGDIPFIRTAEITNNRLKVATTFVSTEAVDDYNLTIYRPGTVLMAMYGQGKTRGQVALLEIPAATSQNAAAIQPGPTIDGPFLWHYLMSQYERLRGMGSLGHVSHLNLGYLHGLEIVRPSPDEQREIATILDAIDAKIDLHRRKRALLDALFQSLLHKLMTGAVRVSDLDLSSLPLPSA